MWLLPPAIGGMLSYEGGIISERNRYSSGDRCFCAGAVKTTSLFEYVFVLVTNRFRVSTLLKVLTLAL